MRLHGDSATGAPAEVVAVLRYEVPRPTQETLAGPGWLRSASIVQVQTARAPHYLFAEVARRGGWTRTASTTTGFTSRSTRPPAGCTSATSTATAFLDVLVTDVNGPVLYRGRPAGRFEDVTATLGLPGAR